MKTIAANIEALNSYNCSMSIAIDRAERGSTVEDDYFIEKLEKTAYLLGYELTKKD